MTMKTAAKALLAVGVAAVVAGALNTQAYAQLDPLQVHQDQAQQALQQRQEAAARKSGHYNAAYWTAKKRQDDAYWYSKLHPQPRTMRPAETKLHFEGRQEDAGEALVQRQEAAARKKGNYNAAYWAAKERQSAGYWNKKGVH